MPQAHPTKSHRAGRRRALRGSRRRGRRLRGGGELRELLVVLEASTPGGPARSPAATSRKFRTAAMS
eukprot:15326178-Alexandrium_andersonii.AAC.1